MTSRVEENEAPMVVISVNADKTFDVDQWIADAPPGVIRLNGNDPAMWRTINGVEQPFRAWHISAMCRGRIIELRQKLWARWMALPFPRTARPPERIQVTFDPKRLR